MQEGSNVTLQNFRALGVKGGKHSFQAILSPETIPLAGFYSVNQSNLIFAPRVKTAVAVLALVNGNETAVRFTT